MNHLFRSVFAALAVAAVAVGVQAQPALKIVTIDVEQALQKYYKTELQQTKLMEQQKKGEEMRNSMVKEGEALVAQAKELQEQAQSTLLNDEARKKAEGDLQKKVGEIRAKEAEIQSFSQQTQQQLRALFGQYQQQAVEEISRVATDIAKKKGATLVLNQAAVIYVDAGFGITDEVVTALNKDRPAPAISLTTPATSATPAPETK